jgi:hypothetical protein
MKFAPIIFLIILSLVQSETAVAQVSSSVANVQTDKAAHFGLSVVMTQTFLRLGQVIGGDSRISWTNRILSSMLAGGVGYAKERYDAEQPGNKFDNEDLVADGAGIIVGNLLMMDYRSRSAHHTPREKMEDTPMMLGAIVPKREGGPWGLTLSMPY